MEEKKFIEYEHYRDDDQLQNNCLNRIAKFDFTDTQNVSQDEILEIIKEYFCKDDAEAKIAMPSFNIVITEEGEAALSIRFGCVDASESSLNKIYHILITAYDVWQEVDSIDHKSTYLCLVELAKVWRKFMIDKFRKTADIYTVRSIKYLEKKGERLKSEIDKRINEQMSSVTDYYTSLN